MTTDVQDVIGGTFQYVAYYLEALTPSDRDLGKGAVLRPAMERLSQIDSSFTEEQLTELIAYYRSEAARVADAALKVSDPTVREYMGGSTYAYELILMGLTATD